MPVQKMLGFIKELLPDHELSKLNYRKMTDDDYKKVCDFILKWNKDIPGDIPKDWVMAAEFIIREED
jgi:hypothetical protein